MPTANDMRTLAHEIFDSYETRIEGVAQIKEATQTQLNDYDEAHKTMAHELHADLTRARTDLAGCSKTQLKEFAEAHKAMGHELHAELARARTDLGQTEAVRKQEEDQRAQERAQVVADRQSDVAAQLQDLDNAHKAMAHELHAELAGARTDLGQAETVRKQEEGQRGQERAQVVADRQSDVAAQLQDLDNAHQAMAQELRTDLAKECAEMKSDVNNFMNDIAAVHAEARDVWQTLTATMQSKRGTPATEKPPVATQPKTVSPEQSFEPGAEQGEAAVMSEEETETPSDLATLSHLVFEYLASHPDGTKLTELENEFGVARFPMAKVIKNLMTESKVGKRDLQYFAT